jgi:hypothetical protein
VTERLLFFGNKIMAKKTKKKIKIEEPDWGYDPFEPIELNDDELKKEVIEKVFRKDKKSFSEGIAVGEQDGPPVGFAYPSFCWELFTGCSVLQASSCYAVGGASGSGKSHFMFEVAKWISRIGGLVHFIENEQKFNEDMAVAVMGRQLAERCYVHSSYSFEEVQNLLNKVLNNQSKLPSEKQLPLLQIVDSIIGSSSQKEQENLDKQGSLGRSYPMVALLASKFLPAYKPKLAEKPYVAFFISHTSETIETRGKIELVDYHMKGGGEWMYCCRMTFILDSRYSGKQKLDEDSGEWLKKMRIRLLKDQCIGHYTLPCFVRSEHQSFMDQETGDTWRERFVTYDWHGSSIEMLLKPESSGYPKVVSEIAREMLGLEICKISGRNYFIAPKIGVTEDDRVVTGEPIMRALYSRENLSLLNDFRAELGIKKGIVIHPNSHFKELLTQSRMIAARRNLRLQQEADKIVIRKGSFSAKDMDSEEGYDE